MSVRIHHLVTGEIEMSLSTALLGEGAYPGREKKDVVPFGFRDDIVRPNGERVEGIMVPVPVWYIEGASSRILIDTGLDPSSDVPAILAAHGIDALCRAAPEHGIEAGLARLGVKPQDIDLVILTHLHFDHCGNNELFDRASFIVQRSELTLALAPHPWAPFYFREFAKYVLAVIDRVETIDGDYRIDRDVQLLKLGGHSPGCTSVLVNTSVGTVALASDAVLTYRNLELDWPPGIFWSLEEVVAGVQRLRECSDLIVPNHDWQFRELFPEGTIGEP